MIDPNLLANESFISLDNLGHGWRLFYRDKDGKQNMLFSKHFDELITFWEDKLEELEEATEEA